MAACVKPPGTRRAGRAWAAWAPSATWRPLRRSAGLSDPGAIVREPQAPKPPTPSLSCAGLNTLPFSPCPDKPTWTRSRDREAPGEQNSGLGTSGWGDTCSALSFCTFRNPCSSMTFHRQQPTVVTSDESRDEVADCGASPKRVETLSRSAAPHATSHGLASSGQGRHLPLQREHGSAQTRARGVPGVPPKAVAAGSRADNVSKGPVTLDVPCPTSWSKLTTGPPWLLPFPCAPGGPEFRLKVDVF